MTETRFEAQVAAQATLATALSAARALSAATDWEGGRSIFSRTADLGNQGYRRDQAASGEATRIRDGVGAAPKVLADASATTSRAPEPIINYSSSGFLNIPKQIEGVYQATDSNPQGQAMPKMQEMPKLPGLTAPEPGLAAPGPGPATPEPASPFPEAPFGRPYPAACDALPGADPEFDRNRDIACPPIGIRPQRE